MGEIKKLNELLGTKYIYGPIIGKLEDVLEQAVANNYTLDLYQCRFLSPHAVNKLNQYYGSVDMINTESKELNKVLEHNCKAARIQRDLKAVERLKFKQVPKSEFKNLINNFDSSKRYYIDKEDFDDAYTKMFAALIMLLKPETEIDAGPFLSDIFNIIRQTWLTSRGYHKAYWEVVNGSALIQRNVDCGRVFVPMEGKINESDFVISHCVLPIEFSIQSLRHTSEFESTLISLIERLTTVKESKHKMKDFIDVAE